MGFSVGLVWGIWGGGGCWVCLPCCCCLLFFKDAKIHTKCKILFPEGLSRHTLKQSLFISQFIVFLLESSTLGIPLTLAPFISHAEQWIVPYSSIIDTCGGGIFQ